MLIKFFYPLFDNGAGLHAGLGFESFVGIELPNPGLEPGLGRHCGLR